MQESPHEREWIGAVRFLTGFVGLTLFVVLGFELLIDLPVILESGGLLIAPIGWILIVTALAGWSGLVYACWIRSGGITGTALAFVLALGICGMAISLFALGGPGDYPLMAIVVLTGIWILNGLGIVWIVQKVRRIRAASNTDTGDAAR